MRSATEVALVEDENVRYVMPVGEHDDRRIGEPEPEVHIDPTRLARQSRASWRRAASLSGMGSACR